VRVFQSGKRAAGSRSAAAVAFGLVCVLSAPAPGQAPVRPAAPAPYPSSWPQIPVPAIPWGNLPPVPSSLLPWIAPTSGAAPVPVVPTPSLPLPSVGPVGSSAITFKRGPDYAFHARGGAPRERSLGQPRDNAWFSDDGGTILAAGGSTGTMFTASGSVPMNVADVFDARFSPDGQKLAIVQARSPLSVRAVPSGAVLWTHQHGLGCAARWMSPTLLVAHDDGANARLWRIDLASNPPRVTPLGGVRRADACWASPDGKRFLVRDDYVQKGGVVWLVDGDTGAASVLAQQSSGSVVGSPAGDRVCFDGSSGTVQCVRVSPRVVETVASDASLDLFSAIDDTGARMLFTSKGTTLIADFASATVRAAPQAPLRSGGSIALLSGGHLVASGSSADTTVFDLDAGTSLVKYAPRAYSVHPVGKRPRSVLVGRQESAGWDLYLEELPP